MLRLRGMTTFSPQISPTHVWARYGVILLGRTPRLLFCLGMKISTSHRKSTSSAWYGLGIKFFASRNRNLLHLGLVLEFWSMQTMSLPTRGWVFLAKLIDSLEPRWRCVPLYWNFWRMSKRQWYPRPYKWGLWGGSGRNLFEYCEWVNDIASSLKK